MNTLCYAQFIYVILENIMLWLDILLCSSIINYVMLDIIVIMSENFILSLKTLCYHLKLYV